ncbi:hypothetical protein PVAP13_1NG149057 [Panicum virgatum]|uniref:Uncharacterized protein n=1 Tax=Panicum virgatum TaxID=38727 RepID=A0A8T0WLS0_PANVG|nr:hypothetical protein PVAP13_1NG149057 [Panicum virgatum]
MQLQQSALLNAPRSNSKEKWSCQTWNGANYGNSFSVRQIFLLVYDYEKHLGVLINSSFPIYLTCKLFTKNDALARL